MAGNTTTVKMEFQILQTLFTQPDKKNLSLDLPDILVYIVHKTSKVERKK